MKFNSDICNDMHLKCKQCSIQSLKSKKQKYKKNRKLWKITDIINSPSSPIIYAKYNSAQNSSVQHSSSASVSINRTVADVLKSTIESSHQTVAENHSQGMDFGSKTQSKPKTQKSQRISQSTKSPAKLYENAPNGSVSVMASDLTSIDGLSFSLNSSPDYKSKSIVHLLLESFKMYHQRSF